jgi:hypothetical protein
VSVYLLLMLMLIVYLFLVFMLTFVCSKAPQISIKDLSLSADFDGSNICM